MTALIWYVCDGGVTAVISKGSGDHGQEILWLLYCIFGFVWVS